MLFNLQIFGAQIEKNMLDNYADQREMVLLLSLLFVFRCCNEQGDPSDFSSATDSSTGPKKTTSCVTLCILLLLLCSNVGLGVSWVPPRPQYWFENLLNSNALNMWWNENFRVTRETFQSICTAVAPVIQRQDTILQAAK